MSHLPRLFPRSRPKRPTTPRRHPQAWSPSHSRHYPERNGQGANRLDLLPPIPGDVLFSGGGWHNLSATSLVQKSYAHPFRFKILTNQPIFLYSMIVEKIVCISSGLAS